MEVEVYSGKVKAWNQLRFWIVVGLQYSRLPVTRTLYNSNLPLTRSNFHSLQNIFCTILSSITWIFFYFPWRFELSGVDCTCKFVSYFFWLIDTKWSEFTILSHQWISRLRLEPEGGAFGYFLGGYVPPGTPNWHPVLEKISPKIDTPF